VTIVFRLPPSAAERVAFSYSPAMEAVLSLHVLVEPKHHPVQHEWVRAMRRLSPALKREVDVLLERFLGLLGSYWEEAFAHEWERIKPDLAASVSEAGRVIARRGLYALLRRPVARGPVRPRYRAVGSSAPTSPASTRL
jgi:hypothetical protein